MPAQSYHKYVFDLRKRKFVGKFEKMYADEDKDNFDSWFQDDLSHLGKQLSQCVINRYNFGAILDIGCGKGAFTQLLKKKNNEVLGTDISQTAIKKAQARYRDVQFCKATAEESLAMRKKWDLIVMMEILSYLKNWKTLIAQIAKKSDYLYVSLYLPSHPIGFVKSFDELRQTLREYFEIEEELLWNNGTILLMARSKNAQR